MAISGTAVATTPDYGNTGIAKNNILIVRNDKLGDFTLALPVFALLRRALPDARLTALVPQYTRGLAMMHPAIDEVLVDPGKDKPGGSARALGSQIAAKGFDSAIVLFSTTRIAVALLVASIPYRLAPATKFAQVFYRHRLTQRRSQSVKPEYEYNLDLARHFLGPQGTTVDTAMRRPVLPIDADTVSRRRTGLASELGLPADAQFIFVHPGHGGSANNLTVNHYAALLRAIGPDKRHAIIVSAGPGEQTLAQELVSRLDCPLRAVYHSQGGLRPFVEALATADVFIGGSTGPLHIAGALNRHTVAFYPRRTSSSALRWQTLNAAERRIAAMPPADADERDMGAIDLTAVAEQVRMQFGHLRLR